MSLKDIIDHFKNNGRVVIAAPSAFAESVLIATIILCWVFFKYEERHYSIIIQEKDATIEKLKITNPSSILASVHEFGIRICRINPIPRISEGVKLRLTDFSRNFPKENIVIGIGVERRVKVNKVNAFVGK